MDTSTGLLKLSDETTDPGDRVTSGCSSFAGSSFTITGRSGLPESPTDTIRWSWSLIELDFPERGVLPPFIPTTVPHETASEGTEFASDFEKREKRPTTRSYSARKTCLAGVHLGQYPEVPLF